MRPVTLFEFYRPEGHVGSPLQREVGIGKFHQWGMDYEEFDSGPGNFSVAIVEMPDGWVKSWPVDMIRFDDV